MLASGSMSFKKSPVLSIPDFKTLFWTRLSSTTALQIQAVIVGWQIYQIKPDPLLLGLVGLAEAIPAISMSFISGHIVDTHRPARVFRWALLAMIFNALLLSIAVQQKWPLEDFHRLILLYVGIFISGAARSFVSPSVFSLIPQIVPREELGSAAAWNSSSYQFASIVGPAMGGLAYAQLGTQLAFALPVLLQTFALTLAFRLTRKTKELKNEFEHETFVKSVTTGIRFAFGHRVLLSTMTLDMFSVLFGGAVAVLPVFANEVFKTGPTGLGLLRAAPSLGSVLVALWLGFKPMKVISGRTLLIVVAGFGLTTIGFSLSANFALALVFLAASGAFDGISMVIRSTLLQILTPENMRGRISSLSSVFITSSNEIGAFESGLAARAMGLIPSVVFGGVMTLVVVGFTWWKIPDLAKTQIDQKT